MPLNSSIQYKPVLPNMSSKLMIPKEELNWSICSSDKRKYSSLCRTGYRSNPRSFISESHNSNSFSSNTVPRHGTYHSSSWYGMAHWSSLTCASVTCTGCDRKEKMQLARRRGPKGRLFPQDTSRVLSNRNGWYLLSCLDMIGEDAWLLSATIILLHHVCCNSVIAFLLW